MSGEDRYGAQTYVRDNKGRLAEGRLYACKNEDEARRIAAARVIGGYATGAAVFRRSGGEEFDEGEIVALETHGVVPPDLLSALPY